MATQNNFPVVSSEGSAINVRPSALKIMGTKVALGTTETTVLRYNDGSDQRNSPSANYMVWRLRLNDVYDPDPLLATGGLTGFNEMSAFFEYWIVTQVQINVTVCNRDTFPDKFAIVLSPTDIATSISSRALALDAMERSGAIFTYELSAQGGMDRCSFAGRIRPGKVLGFASEYMLSGLYGGTATSSPTNELFIVFILVAPPSVSITQGIFYNLEISYKVKFYNQVSTLLGHSFRSFLLQERTSLYREGISLVDIDRLIDRVRKGEINYSLSQLAIAIEEMRTNHRLGIKHLPLNVVKDV